jgi:hypothetical protein
LIAAKAANGRTQTSVEGILVRNYARRTYGEMSIDVSRQILSLPVNSHSIVFSEARAKRRSTAAPISLLPCSYFESCLFRMRDKKLTGAWGKKKKRPKRPSALVFKKCWI